MTDRAGAVQYAANYDPYGGLLESYGTPFSSFGFTGEQSDANGLLYLRARYYDANLGAFLARDPVAGVMARSNSRNGYSYVEGNPVNYVDPTGAFIQLHNPLADFFNWVKNEWAPPRAAAIGDWVLQHSGTYDTFDELSYLLGQAEYGITGRYTPWARRGAWKETAQAMLTARYRDNSGYQQVRGDLEPFGWLVSAAMILDGVRSIPNIINGLGGALRSARTTIGTTHLFLDGGQLAIAAQGTLRSASGVLGLNALGSNIFRMSSGGDNSGIPADGPKSLFDAKLTREKDYPVEIDADLSPDIIENQKKYARWKHNVEAHRQLREALEANPEFRQRMISEHPNVVKWVKPDQLANNLRRAPPGYAWHHHTWEEGIIQLMTKADHDRFRGSLHLPPRNRGGFDIWGIY